MGSMRGGKGVEVNENRGDNSCPIRIKEVPR